MAIQGINIPLDMGATILDLHGKTGNNTAQEDSPSSPSPAIIYDMQNVMPSELGYYSCFAPAGLRWGDDDLIIPPSGNVFDITPDPWGPDYIIREATIANQIKISRVQNVVPYETMSGIPVLFILTEEGLFLNNFGGHLGGGVMGERYTLVETLLQEDAKLFYLWTFAYLDNRLYLYKQGQDFVYVAGDPTIAEDLKNWKSEITVVHEDFSINLCIVKATPTFINMEDQVGIFQAGGRLGFWDSDNSIGWSSVFDKLDFLPDVISLAGNAKFSDVQGTIVQILSTERGFNIYSTSSIVAIDHAAGSQETWRAEVLVRGTGINYYFQATSGSDPSQQFAWTRNGLYHITGKQATTILHDEYRHLNTKRSDGPGDKGYMLPWHQGDEFYNSPETLMVALRAIGSDMLVISTANHWAERPAKFGFRVGKLTGSQGDYTFYLPEIGANYNNNQIGKILAGSDPNFPPITDGDYIPEPHMPPENYDRKLLVPCFSGYSYVPQSNLMEKRRKAPVGEGFKMRDMRHPLYENITYTVSDPTYVSTWRGVGWEVPFTKRDWQARNKHQADHHDKFYDQWGADFATLIENSVNAFNEDMAIIAWKLSGAGYREDAREGRISGSPGGYEGPGPYVVDSTDIDSAIRVGKWLISGTEEEGLGSANGEVPSIRKLDGNDGFGEAVIELMEANPDVANPRMLVNLADQTYSDIESTTTQLAFLRGQLGEAGSSEKEKLLIRIAELETKLAELEVKIIELENRWDAVQDAYNNSILTPTEKMPAGSFSCGFISGGYDNTPTGRVEILVDQCRVACYADIRNMGAFYISFIPLYPRQSAGRECNLAGGNDSCSSESVEWGLVSAICNRDTLGCSREADFGHPSDWLHQSKMFNSYFYGTDRIPGGYGKATLKEAIAWGQVGDIRTSEHYVAIFEAEISGYGFVEDSPIGPRFTRTISAATLWMQNPEGECTPKSPSYSRYYEDMFREETDNFWRFPEVIDFDFQPELPEYKDEVPEENDYPELDYKFPHDIYYGAILRQGTTVPYYPRYQKAWVLDLSLNKWGSMDYEHSLVFPTEAINSSRAVIGVGNPDGEAHGGESDSDKSDYIVPYKGRVMPFGIVPKFLGPDRYGRPSWSDVRNKRYRTYPISLLQNNQLPMMLHSEGFASRMKIGSFALAREGMTKLTGLYGGAVAEGAVEVRGSYWGTEFGAISETPLTTEQLNWGGRWSNSFNRMEVERLECDYNTKRFQLGGRYQHKYSYWDHPKVPGYMKDFNLPFILVGKEFEILFEGRFHIHKLIAYGEPTGKLEFNYTPTHFPWDPRHLEQMSGDPDDTFWWGSYLKPDKE